ncbi:Slam-dependent surface lipoprotein [Mannheimia granulomatis]|uniref:Factor H binding protein-like C-terminal domain-containing protein n=2 Tax=Mannheimia granulomatis TaxID=85402 RepID=A0A011P4I1_9PAST|nr:hypothetical protein AK33_10695 [Mannheimia granulomatis]
MERIISGEGPNASQFNATVEVRGLKTDKLPTEGRATYKGKAFDAHGDAGLNGGSLTYDVDFSNRKGSGKVENEYGGHINLEQGNIENGGISSTAHRYHKDNSIESGSYNIEFFGPKAEEIGGKIEINGNGGTDRLGISGTRGEIQK